MEATALPRRGG